MNELILKSHSTHCVTSVIYHMFGAYTQIVLFKLLKKKEKKNGVHFCICAVRLQIRSHPEAPLYTNKTLLLYSPNAVLNRRTLSTEMLAYKTPPLHTIKLNALIQLLS